MSKSLSDLNARAALFARLNELSPDSPRQWGRMTPHQAMCHLADSFRAMMSPSPITSISNLFTRTVLRWVAIHSGLKWPHGVKTMPEVDQDIGGTKPIEFMRDKRELEKLMDQFTQRTADTLQPHPIFGKLSTTEWQRWGWLHVDHHLRQFNR